MSDPLAREVLRVLELAEGPLTVDDVRRRIAARAHGCLPYGDVYNRLVQLASRGELESRCDRFVGHHPCRLFWPARSA